MTLLPVPEGVTVFSSTLVTGDRLHLHGHADVGAPPSRLRVLQRHGQALRGAPPVDQPGNFHEGLLLRSVLAFNIDQRRTENWDRF